MAHGNCVTKRPWSCSTGLGRAGVIVSAVLAEASAVVSRSTDPSQPNSGRWTLGSVELNPAVAEMGSTPLQTGGMMIYGGMAYQNNQLMTTTFLIHPNSSSITQLANSSDNNGPSLGPSIAEFADGEAIVACGFQADFTVTYIYNRANDSWRNGPRMNTNRLSGCGMVSLGLGRVLVAGGDGIGGAALVSAEVFDASTNSFKEVSNMLTKRAEFQLALLPDGRVLAAGGSVDVAGSGDAYPTSACEIWDPEADKWVPTVNMSVARVSFGLAVLPNGMVLAAGGFNTESEALSSAEVFDPSQQQWFPVTPMPRSRMGFAMANLGDGTIMAIGGSTGTDQWIKINGSVLYHFNQTPPSPTPPPPSPPGSVGYWCVANSTCLYGPRPNPSFKGGTLEQCQSICNPKYACESDKCIVSTRGGTLEQCQAVCV